MTQNSLTNYAKECQTNTSISVPSQEKLSSDERGTSREEISRILTANNGLFEMDLASGAEPEPIGLIKLTKEDDSLTSSWNPDDYNITENDADRSVTRKSAWLNPPFSMNREFAEKVSEEINRPYLDYIVFLSTAQAVTANWYQDNILPHAEYVCFPDARYHYTNAGNKTDFSSILTIVGDAPNNFPAFFDREGKCLQVKHDVDVSAQIHDFIENSVHNSPSSPSLISTQYEESDPILNNVGRGDQLELSVRESARGYPDLDILNKTLTVTVYTWQEHDEYYDVIANLPVDEGPYSEQAFFTITVQKDNPSSFTVARQVGDELDWKPVPVADIKTITDKIHW